MVSPALAESQTSQPPGLTLHGKFVVLLASAMTIMASATISPSLPGLKAHFSDAPNVDMWVRLILTMPSLTVALTAIAFGMLVDRIGRKPILIGAICLYGASGVAGFFVDSLEAIVISRAFLGVAKAALLTVCTTLIADCFSGHHLRSFMGVQAAAIKIGGIVLIFAAGFLADENWRWPFLLYGVVFLALIGSITDIKETKPQETRKTHGEIGHWGQKTIAIAVMLVVVTVITQAVFYQLPLELPFYITRTFDGSGAQIGIALSITALMAGIAGLLYARLRSIAGFNAVLALSFLAYAGGLAIMAVAQSYGALLLGVATLGVGLGLVVPNISVWMVEIVPAGSRGFAMGLITMMTFLGQFASAFMLSPIGAAAGLRGSFAIMAGGCLVLAAVFLFGAMASRAPASPARPTADTTTG